MAKVKNFDGGQKNLNVLKQILRGQNVDRGHQNDLGPQKLNAVTKNDRGHHELTAVTMN